MDKEGTQPNRPEEKKVDDGRTNRTTMKTKKQKREEKQLYGYFKRQTAKISHKKTRTWLRKGNLKRASKSLLIASSKATP